MEKKEFSMEQVKGTENPNNQLHSSSDNSIEMISNEFQQVYVCDDRRNPSSDNHLLCDILSRLPVKSLMRFKCVSKRWKILIEVDRYLHELHYKRSKANLCGQRRIIFISSTTDKKKSENHIMNFSTCLPGSPLVDVKRLVLDCSYGIPRQAVNGLVCIPSGDAFLIYNPSTGERSPWIETTIASEGNSGKGKRQILCLGFGFDLKTNQHKVICISSVKKLEEQETRIDLHEAIFGRLFSCKDEEIEDYVCEVLVVGEITWRRIDEVPPYNLRTKDCYGVDDGYIYVNGSLYWRFRYTRKGEVIVGFDFGSEKFRVIQIPDSIIDPYVYKFSQTVELLEVDGHITVLKWIDSHNIYLWILDEDGDRIKWTEEVIALPYLWNAKTDLDIEALPGTNLIILGPQYPCKPDSFYYYNRSTKKFSLSRIPLDDHFQLTRITSVVESLAPVHAARRSTF